MPAETHSRRSPVDPEEVARVVRERLAEILEIEEDAVVPPARLRADLHADDFALIEWAETLEDELGERTVGFHLDDDDLVELDTVSDAIDCVVARLATAAPGERELPDPVDLIAEPADVLERSVGYRFRDRAFLERALS